MEAKKLNVKLPPNINSFSGDWEDYLDNIHLVFLKTLFENKLLVLFNLPVRLKKNPEYKEKSFTFWHLISQGEKEEERIPDIRRCERLGWIHWVIENVLKNPDIVCWENKRGTKKHLVLWYDKESYAVILERRRDYFLLKTAYKATPNRARTFRKEMNIKKHYTG